jgi:hypothetical protein
MIETSISRQLLAYTYQFMYQVLVVQSYDNVAGFELMQSE